MRLIAFLSLAALCLPAAAAQQPDYSKVEIKPEKAGSNIWMLTGEGGNIGVSTGEDGIVLVDDQFAPLTEKISTAVAKLGTGPVRFVINTHSHHDHVGGNENFGKLGGIIVAHESVRNRMSTEQFIRFFQKKVPPYPKQALPVVTFVQDVTLHFNNDEIYIFHVDPAHTDGDSVVWFKKANVVHMGDLFFSSFYPFIDMSSGGSSDGVIKANRRVIPMIDGKTTVIPGHGPMSNKAGMESYVTMLETCRSNVLAMIEEGKTLEQIKAARPTKEFDAHWGNGFLKPDKFVELLYDDLTSKAAKR